MIDKETDKGNSNFERFTREDMRKHPERYLQPWVKKDNFGRDYCNPDFVRLYGNPHNDVRKKDIYLERSRDQMCQDKEDVRIANYVDVRKEGLKTHTMNKYTLRPIFRKEELTKWDYTCKVCGCYNNEKSVLCWYCLTRVDY